MKRTTIIIIVLVVLALSLSVAAYDKPDSTLGYIWTEGGASPFESYFKDEISAMTGNSHAIFELLLEDGMDSYHKVYEQRLGGLLATGETAEQYYLERNKWAKIPREHDIITTFKITKEQFAAANNLLDVEDRYTDEEIELLFGGDMEALLKYCKHKHAYVYGDEIFCFKEALMLDYEKQYEMYTKSDFGDYLKGYLTGEALQDGYGLGVSETEWLNYVSEKLFSGVKPEAPQTGDNTALVFVFAVASAFVATAAKRHIAHRH